MENITICNPRKVAGNLEGWGIPKAKIFNRKYEALLDLPVKNVCGGRGGGGGGEDASWMFSRTTKLNY